MSSTRFGFSSCCEKPNYLRAHFTKQVEQPSWEQRNVCSYKPPINASSMNYYDPTFDFPLDLTVKSSSIVNNSRPLQIGSLQAMAAPIDMKEQFQKQQQANPSAAAYRFPGVQSVLLSATTHIAVNHLNVKACDRETRHIFKTSVEERTGLDLNSKCSYVAGAPPVIQNISNSTPLLEIQNLKERQSLEHHPRPVRKRQRMSCPFGCGKDFASRSGLWAHRRMPGAEPYACDWPSCGQRFAYRNVFKDHMKIHTGEKRYVCKVCGEKCAHSWSLKRHMLVHAGENTFACDLCGKKFAQSQHLEDHMSTHAGNKNCESPQLHWLL